MLYTVTLESRYRPTKFLAHGDEFLNGSNIRGRHYQQFFCNVNIKVKYTPRLTDNYYCVVIN